jgi:hypothetical protein
VFGESVGGECMGGECSLVEEAQEGKSRERT